MQKGGVTANWRQSFAAHAGESFGAAAFSPDGSLLAAAAGDSITLWQPQTNALLLTLAAPLGNRGSPFHAMAFLAGSPTLVAASGPPSPTLVAWNLASRSVVWSSNVVVASLAADPQHACFAAVVSLATGGGGPGAVKGAVAVFDGGAPVPRQLWALPSSAASRTLFAPLGSALHAAGVSLSPKVGALLGLLARWLASGFGMSDVVMLGCAHVRGSEHACACVCVCVCKRVHARDM